MQSGIHDQFVGELVRAVSLMRQGDGFREDVTQGPLINDSAVDKVRTRKVKPVFCTADMISNHECTSQSLKHAQNPKTSELFWIAEYI